MSTETSELNQPSDSDEPLRYTYRSADSAVDQGDLEDDDVEDDDVEDDDDDVTPNAVLVDEDDDDDDEEDDPDDDLAVGTVYQSVDDQGVVETDSYDPQPTFTPVASEPVTVDGEVLPDGEVVTDEVDEDVLPDGEVVTDEVVEDDLPDGEVVTDEVVTPGYLSDPYTADDAPVTDAVPAAETVDVPVVDEPVAPVAAVNETGPLLGDAISLRASWQQAAAGFVDDPRAAVAEAADLVEQTAQTLIGALQQRQSQLRGRWETAAAAGDDTGYASSNGSDTEELRQLMQNYRALFNQLCVS